ncbi:MAG: helix-turn-helix transcriptional regulator [Lachnospiraceae bacterium]|jgi:putative transcriptional regulator|nr:helix-turn-helix transcriptional regulator [Lachnospiraceae bacterium]
MISYAPFWETLKRKQISQYQLIRDYSFSTGTLDTLRKNNSITMNTLHDICQMLQCNITDVVEFVEDKKE